MRHYASVDGDSGIAAYESGSDFMRVEFSDGSVYLYSYGSAGAHNIERMKVLAASGEGLNTFINRYVRGAYDRQER